jgi:hypothetical protein
LSRTHSLNSRAEILVPVFLLDEPVWPKPLQAAAVGAATGLSIAIAGLALVAQLRRRR